MSSPQSQEKGFLDHLSSPLTLLPLGGGVSLCIVAWVLPQLRTMLFFLGAVSALVGVGSLLTQWLLGGPDPRLAEARRLFAVHLDAARRLDAQLLPQEAKLMATPAVAEGP